MTEPSKGKDIFIGGMLLLVLASFPQVAFAARLEIAEDASMLVKAGAAFLLYTHILAGAIGISSGFVASFAKKGQTLHRKAGKVFFLSMGICYVIAAAVAPFLDTEQRTNFVAAVLALYLLFSARDAATRRNFVAGFREVVGLLVALVISSAGLYFMWLAQQSPTGTVDGAPPQAFVLFVVAGTTALVGEIRVLVVRRLPNVHRIARHLWRMCMSFFIASGSLFFGQAGFFPTWFSDSFLPILFGFFPFAILLIGLWQTYRPLQRLNLFSKTHQNSE